MISKKKRPGNARVEPEADRARSVSAGSRPGRDLARERSRMVFPARVGSLSRGKQSLPCAATTSR